MYPHSPGFSDYTAAARTRLGGILSVYGYHLATSIFRFVVEQLPKQSKTRIVPLEKPLCGGGYGLSYGEQGDVERSATYQGIAATSEGCPPSCHRSRPADF